MPTTPHETVAAFVDAANRHDIPAVAALLADDVIFESTEPAPDGHRYAGKTAVLAVLDPILGAEGSRFVVEETVAAGDRVALRSTYHWSGGRVRGLDLIRTANGTIVEILSYVKG